ncbi:hypothetical protein HN587_06450 [Candidatus Woesearchaeota archaeon]|nr:hypothetical protein [Candidatus Woesearchaeota archaeon]
MINLVLILSLVVIGSEVISGPVKSTLSGGIQDPDLIMGENSITNKLPLAYAENGFWMAFCNKAGEEHPIFCGKIKEVKSDIKVHHPNSVTQDTFLLNYSDSYDFFDIPPNEEVVQISLKFPAEIFKNFDNQFYSSHYWPKGTFTHEDALDLVKAEIETGCAPYSVDTIRKQYDANGYFVGDNAIIVDGLCLDIYLLNHKSCSDMADVNNQFCEGIDSVAPNTVDVNGQYNFYDGGGIGWGGCNPFSGSDGWDGLVSGRNYGRDWLVSGKGDTGNFSPYYLVQNEVKQRIGGCCGNDINGSDLVIQDFDLDIGALKSGEFANSGSAGDMPNQYICANVPKPDLPITDFKSGYGWLDASRPEFNFNIHTVNKNVQTSNISYDIISYNSNWFICDDGSNELNNFYEYALPVNSLSSKWTEQGPLLKKYQRVPEVVEVGGNYGVTEGFGQEGSGSGDVLGQGIGGGSSDAKLVDIDEFSAPGSTHGSTEFTSCDKDGDGYDGFWVLSEDDFQTLLEQGAIKDETDDPCYNPQPINGVYDCQDLPELNGTKMNPGMVEFCGDGIDNDCDKGVDKEDPEGCVYDKEANLVNGMNFTNAHLFPRFVCHNEDEKGTFVECCGYNLNDCKNDFPNARRMGSPVDTLVEFHNWAGNKCGEGTSNCILQYKIKLPSSEDKQINNPYYLALYLEDADSKIINWEDHEYLEFYVWFTTNFHQNLFLGKYIGPEGDSSGVQGKKRTHENYQKIIEVPIIDYVVNEISLRKWLHVKVPISIIPVSEQMSIGLIALHSYPVNLFEIDQNYDEQNDNINDYSNLIALDRFFLTPKKSELTKVELEGNLFCTGTFPVSTWIDDLDNDNLDKTKYGPFKIGHAVCDSMPGYKWTGNYCCGDDGGNNSVGLIFGEGSFKEYYTDINGSCWGSSPILEPTRFLPVIYNITHGSMSSKAGQTEEIIRVCKNASCNFYVSPEKGVGVSNVYSDVYDLHFAGPGFTLSIGNNAYSSSEINSIKVKGKNGRPVPLKVQFYNQTFLSCNGEDYFFNNEKLRVTAGDKIGNQLILAEDNYISTDDFCEVQGDYFCSHYSGWSDEIVYNGTGYEQHATSRNITKKVINLINNPSFEET